MGLPMDYVNFRDALAPSSPLEGGGGSGSEPLDYDSVSTGRGQNTVLRMHQKCGRFFSTIFICLTHYILFFF